MAFLFRKKSEAKKEKLQDKIKALGWQQQVVWKPFKWTIRSDFPSLLPANFASIRHCSE